jgi:hypothetical protein
MARRRAPDLGRQASDLALIIDFRVFRGFRLPGVLILIQGSVVSSVFDLSDGHSCAATVILDRSTDEASAARRFVLSGSFVCSSCCILHDCCFQAQSGRGLFMDSVIDVQGRQLKLSNLDKVLYPAAGFTKKDVIDYYVRIAPAILPHLKGRALTRKRYPDGVDGEPF